MEHTWQFFRAGGVDQVLIRTGADIAHLAELDQKLWVALACPTRGVEFDTRTLDLIDANNDGRIRPPELLAACQWAVAQVNDPDVLVQGGDAIDLSAIRADADGDTPNLADEARRILQVLGREGATSISLADVADRGKLLAAMRFNGDGVVTPQSAHDDAVAKTITQIMTALGSVKDQSGEEGIDKAKAETFFKQVKELQAWQATVASDQSVMPLGEQTAAAAQALVAVRAKVDDFFARCRVADYDARALPALNPSVEEYQKLGAEALTLKSDKIAELPLAPVGPGKALPLTQGVNPAWAQALAALKTSTLDPLLGEAQTLSEAAWQQVQKTLAPFLAWTGTRPTTNLDGLAVAELQQLDASAEAAVLSLIEQDAHVAPHNARIVDLEKLLRFKRDLLHLLNNFVSFSEFYRRHGAIFQAGTLYLDARSCELTVRVDDAGKHAPLAGLAKAYLAYCTCTRKGEKMTIVAAFTAGDTDFLFVGRNGIFYDRQGNDWDATITKLIDNPTSIGQAVFSPYKKFLRMIEEQVAKRAAASDAAAQGKLSSMATTLTTADKANPQTAAATAPGPSKVDVGTVAAIGVALGSISAVMVGIFGKFVDLGGWIPVAIIGILIAISGPSVLIAWLKLRQRSLGPILDASGWAINGRMRINVRLGGSLSQIAKVPSVGLHRLNDPYADKHGKAYGLGIAALVLVVVGVAWRFEWLNPLLPASLQRASAVPAVSVIAPPTAATPAPVPAPAAPATAP